MVSLVRPYSYDVPEGTWSVSADPAASVVTLFESHNHRISSLFLHEASCKKKRKKRSLCKLVRSRVCLFLFSKSGHNAGTLHLICTRFTSFQRACSCANTFPGSSFSAAAACVLRAHIATTAAGRSWCSQVPIRGAIKSIFPLLVVLQCWPASPAQCGGAEVQQRHRMIRCGGGEEKKYIERPNFCLFCANELVVPKLEELIALF